ncbi:triose-phosphate isomerase [Candidatus Poribacteria bacterium]|nr:triose-phosphate isomerase [Candidatus Poribacteria bacterium]
MRKPLIAGNWKMYKTQSEAKSLVNEILSSLKDVKNVDILVIPTFTSLTVVYDIVKNSNIKLGAQNIYFEKEGAYTGEISPLMIKDAGCEFVIIGHSERRQYFGDTDESVNKKIKSALTAQLKPIFCIGESLMQRENNEHEKIIDKQLSMGLAGISEDAIVNATIAYEPIWAIGTGKTATPEIANTMHKFIRNKIKNLYNQDISESMRILYGGSVKPDNISILMKEKHIDGALVGGASLQAVSFANIVKFS